MDMLLRLPLAYTLIPILSFLLILTITILLGQKEEHSIKGSVLIGMC